jgi:glycosyltransferase involved in cell wall biosynthesis
LDKTLKKRTILFAVQLPPPVHGSAIINELIINNKLINENFKMEVLPIQMAQSMEDMGFFSFRKFLNTILIFLKQTRIILTKQIDLYYIALSPIGFAFSKDFILVTIAKIFNKKIILHLHGQGIGEAASQNFFKKSMYRFVFKNAQVICLAKPLYDDIESVYEGAPYFLANGIKKEPELIYNIKSTSFVFLSNLRKDKGIEIFLQALLKLKQKGYDFSAKIIGSSSDYSNEEAQEFLESNGLNEVVSVLGPIFGVEKYDHLTDAKVLVLPSFRECFPLTLLEAYQSKTAVISTNTGAIPEIISNGENGYVVEPNDVDALFDKMELFLKNERLHTEMGELNFIKFEENYTQEIFITNLLQILNSVLK